MIDNQLIKKFAKLKTRKLSKFRKLGKSQNLSKYRNLSKSNIKKAKRSFLIFSIK